MKLRSEHASPMSTAVVHILLALASGDLHGYGIIQEVGRQSNGRYKLGPGTLYDNLKKLMDTGMVVDAPKPASASDDERRLYDDGGRTKRAGVGDRSAAERSPGSKIAASRTES